MANNELALEGGQGVHNMKTKVWGNPEKAKVLVIGHDPGLQRSSMIAEYSLFADYFYRSQPIQKRELAKYRLAQKMYDCIKELTSGWYSDDDVLITNLCNEVLTSSPPHKINYIPLREAREGLKAIRTLLKDSSVKLIFPMSQQVNYWLQELGFYNTDTKFIEKSEPKYSGVESEQPYYQPRQSGVFKDICGNKYIVDGKYYLFPILHVKSYPLKGRFITYHENYENCKRIVREVIDSTGEK